MTDMTNNVDHMTGKTNDETVMTIPMIETTQDVTVTTVINGRISVQVSAEKRPKLC